MSTKASTDLDLNKNGAVEVATPRTGMHASTRTLRLGH